MMNVRPAAALSLAVFLAACGAAEPTWAPQNEVQRALYAHDGSPSVVLYTVINNETGAGGHSALMINGSQRVIWDPAGTWWNPASPERNDVHYGITPRMEDIYVDYHARVTWRVVTQEVPVSRSTADQLIAAVEAYGAVPKAQCSASTTKILAANPAFAPYISSTWYPKKLMEQFDAIPGMSKAVVYDDDDDNNQPLLREQIAAGQNGLR